ncbi:MAG: glutamate racemase [Nitrospirae bacterium]|nr:glutamate racemase [Nitrospirota bacterium]
MTDDRIPVSREGERPIGVFDSGVGGLTVVKELFGQLPGENIIYFGDTARVPYGIKSDRTVVKFSLQNSRFLAQFKIKLLIVACNTASAVGLDILRKEFPFPVLGVIEPGARAALRLAKNKRIGVIGTEATVSSRAYVKLIEGINPSARIFSQACSLFVPLVEEGWLEGEITAAVVRKYLSSLKKKSIDSLILGCTHYPLLKPLLQKEMEGIVLIDSAREVVAEAKKVLGDRGMLGAGNRTPYRRYYVSDMPARFVRVGKMFLGEDITPVEQVEIEKY